MTPMNPSCYSKRAAVFGKGSEIPASIGSPGLRPFLRRDEHDEVAGLDLADGHDDGLGKPVGPDEQAVLHGNRWEPLDTGQVAEPAGTEPGVEAGPTPPAVVLATVDADVPLPGTVVDHEGRRRPPG